MASTADFRNGLCIEFNHDIFQIIEFQHVKPGKGGAFVRTKIKSMTTGRVLDHTFISGHKVTTARIERRNFQYLYSDDMGFHFMNNESYEQISLQKDFIPRSELMKEGQEIDILYHAETEKAISVELPAFVTLAIKYSEPGLKGDTATNATKSATLETGAVINVPLFINEGEKIKVDTRTGEYVERVKD